MENLRHAIAMFVCHFNYCRVHSAHKQTPAQAAGLTDKVWTIMMAIRRLFPTIQFHPVSF
jgi:hypothetical protein